MVRAVEEALALMVVAVKTACLARMPPTPVMSTSLCLATVPSSECLVLLTLCWTWAVWRVRVYCSSTLMAATEEEEDREVEVGCHNVCLDFFEV